MLNNHHNRAVHQGTLKVGYSVQEDEELLLNQTDKIVHSVDDDDMEEVVVQPPLTVAIEDDLLSDWSGKGINIDYDDDEELVVLPASTVSVDDIEDIDDSGSMQFKGCLEKHKYK